MTYSLGQSELDGIEEILKVDLIDVGVHCVFLIDMAGNIIASLDNGKNQHDIYSLAALAAGNFGEEEFSLLFHKGQKESIHFTKVFSDFLLITIFGQEISLGFLRLKVSEAIEKIKETLGPSLEV